MLLVKAWTMRYEPFRCGGSLWNPVIAEVEAEGPFDLGKGFHGHVFTSGEGRFHVAESETGALVGAGVTMESALEAVRKDIDEAEETVMAQQIVQAKETVQRATEIESTEFLRLLSKGK